MKMTMSPDLREHVEKKLIKKEIEMDTREAIKDHEYDFDNPDVQDEEIREAVIKRVEAMNDLELINQLESVSYDLGSWDE